MKRLFSLILFFILLASNITNVLAQSGTAKPALDESQGITLEEQQKLAPSDLIMPPIGGGGSTMPFAGQNQYYSVVFRGNGESIVTLRVALTNTTSAELRDFTFRIPKITDPKDLSAYQILMSPPCIRYEDRQAVQVYPYTPKCAEYGEPNYEYPYNAKYQKAKVSFSGDTLKVTLPTAIQSNRTGAFFVYFRGFGYSKKTVFGAYKYDFETFKIDDQVNQLRLGINTDSDLFLKGVKGEVGYRTNEASVAMKALPTADGAGVANTMVDNFVSQIGQGQIVKTASNLAKLESYKVQGMYASSRAKLYGRELLTVAGIIILLLIVLLTVFKVLHSRLKVNEKESKKEVSMSAANILLCAGVSFGSALISAGYTIAVFAIGNALSSLVDYQFQAIVMILLVVISFAVYVLLLIGPSVIVGFKRGLGWGMGTFAMTIGWMIMMAILTIGVLFIFRNQPYYPVTPFVKSTMMNSGSSPVEDVQTLKAQ